MELEDWLERLGEKSKRLGELQQWQKDILEMTIEDDESWTLTNENEIPITQSQMKMLEEVLGDDFYIGDSGIREVLEAVLECGFYFTRDKKILNLARESYLKGRNWIKTL
jgi:hypothetical protein